MRGKAHAQGLGVQDAPKWGPPCSPLPDVRPSVCLSLRLGEASVTVGLRTYLCSRNSDLGSHPSSATSKPCHRPWRVISLLCSRVVICNMVLTMVPNTYVFLCGLNSCDRKRA